MPATLREVTLTLSQPWICERCAMEIHEGHRTRLRDRYMQEGLDSFNDINTLELLLFYAVPRVDTNPIAHALLNKFGSLSNVLKASADELKQVKGIGDSAAALITLVGDIDRKAKLADKRKDIKRILSSTDAAEFLKSVFADCNCEMIYMLGMDASRRLLFCKELGTGALTSVEFNIRKAVSVIVNSGAVSVIISHNHPGGVCRPSQDDIDMTHQFKDALKPFNDVTFDDHIIIAGEDYFSFADNGLM